MRLLIAVLVALSLLGLATAAAGYQELASYRDEFNTVSYSGTDGPTPWTTSWTEIGEDDGASTGMVRVESSGNCFGSDCLVFESGLLDSIGAQRFASLKDWDSAQLGYDVSSTNLLSLVNTGTLVVEVTSDGTSWLVVDQYGLGDTPGHRSLNLMQVWLTDGFGVRFRAVALTNATIFVDNVEISGTIAYEDTTTSTTTTSTTTTTRATTTSTATTTTSDTPTTTSGVDSTAPTDGVNQTTSTTTTLAAPTTTTTMSQG
ncbi:MAG TPA: hypothetical protein VE569_07330, partial [Acidimicrobiia bacterium]|nr:hypothetical protein [Acidimicrobiia bacterium]